MTPQAEKVLATLRESLTKAKEAGVTIVWGRFGNKETTCCAVSSLAVAYPEKRLCCTPDYARFLALERLAPVWEIVSGFDNSKVSQRSEFYEVGQILRKEFVESE